MENKRELFDLKAEKRELDAFLSKVAETTASLSVKGVVQTREIPSSFAEDKSTKSAPGKKTDEANLYDCETEKKSVGTGKRIWILIVLLVALLIGYFWFYPERGSKIMEVIKSYVPVFKTDQGAVSSSVEGINLMNVRQKLIYNVTLKRNIRVLEGIAENSTPRPVSKIKIAAILYNAEGSLLASTESFGGNIIIDENLESLDADGILAALKDVKTMEDRIQPKGQIPFMIVFTSEPAGVHKLSVFPADFKKH